MGLGLGRSSGARRLDRFQRRSRQLRKQTLSLMQMNRGSGAMSAELLLQHGQVDGRSIGNENPLRDLP